MREVVELLRGNDACQIPLLKVGKMRIGSIRYGEDFYGLRTGQ